MTKVNLQFNWLDYVVFCGLLAGSALIGAYHAFCGNKQNTTEEYLLGGRKLGLLPVTLSVLVSSVSTNSMLGSPSEMFLYGTMYMWAAVGCAIMLLVTAYYYVPVYYNLRLTTSFEYCELRFNKTVGRTAAAIFAFHTLTFMSLVSYGSSLALSHVTGLGLWPCVCIVCGVCMFYTTLGGLKAVVWADSLQAGVMISAVLTMLIKGTYDVGGVGVVWQRNMERQRIDFFNFSPDPTERLSFWSVMIGSTVAWMYWYAVNHSLVQRYLSTKSLKITQRCILLDIPGLCLTIIMCCLVGLVAFAHYYDCHPEMSGKVDKMDQIFPLLVMETVGHIPGLPGLFVAGMLSASLSSISSGWNALASVAFNDFIKGLDRFKDISDAAGARISKILCAVFAVITIAFVAVVAQMGGILEASFILDGISGGPMLGLFTLGLMFPQAKPTGAMSGVICAMAVTLWLGLGAFFDPVQTERFLKPTYVDGCEKFGFNISEPIIYHSANYVEEESFNVYHISYMWYTLIGVLVTIIVGLIVSIATDDPDHKVDGKYLSPLYHQIKWFCEKWSYSSVNKQDQNKADSAPAPNIEITKPQTINGSDTKQHTNGETVAKPIANGDTVLEMKQVTTAIDVTSTNQKD